MALHADIPTRAQLDRLLVNRDPVSVSVYLPTRRSWLSGATVLAVRHEEIPDDASVAAILRYRI